MASEDVTTRAEQRLAELLRDGRMHLEAMEHEDSHFAGPDPECSACDDIYGEANLLRDLLAEVARLREEVIATVSELRGGEENEGELHSTDLYVAGRGVALLVNAEAGNWFTYSLIVDHAHQKTGIVGERETEEQSE